MFLIRDGVDDMMMRLMIYKSNPWLKFDYAGSEHDSEICKHATFMSTGFALTVPELKMPDLSAIDYSNPRAMELME